MVLPMESKQKEYLTIVDKNYTYLSASPLYLKITGVESQDIINKKISDIWKDVIIQNQIIDNIDQALSGKTITFRGNFKFGDSKKWYRVKYSPLAEQDGSINKVIISTLDIQNEINAINKIKKALRIDVLTGIHNRRAFEEDLKQAASKKQKYTIMLFDLDNFKSVNDNYGHSSGDLALKESSQIFKTNISKIGKVYRIGGDEFAGIVSITNQSKLSEISENIIQQLKIAKFNKKFQVGVSIGALIINDKKKLSIENQLELVDSSMYKSKANGKNKYTISTI